MPTPFSLDPVRPVGVKLSSADRALLDRYAAGLGVSRSAAVMHAVRLALGMPPKQPAKHHLNTAQLVPEESVDELV